MRRRCRRHGRTLVRLGACEMSLKGSTSLFQRTTSHFPTGRDTEIGSVRFAFAVGTCDLNAGRTSAGSGRDECRLRRDRRTRRIRGKAKVAATTKDGILVIYATNNHFRVEVRELR